MNEGNPLMRIRQVLRSTVGVLALCCLGLPNLVHADSISSSAARSLVDDLMDRFNSEARPLRQGVPLLPMTHLQHDGKRYFYLVPTRLMRMQGQPKTRFILKNDRIRLDRREISVTLASNTGAELRLVIRATQDPGEEFIAHVLPEVLREIFDYETPERVRRYVGNKSSRLLHIVGCNHLPSQDDRQVFGSPEEARSASFQDCPLCFAATEMPTMDNYSTVRARALESSRLHEIAFPPVESDEAQSRVERLGHRVVETFPLAPRGYEYRFRVLQSELVRGSSFPTGFVYVYDSLLNAIEEESELAFVLAHEIAHVELYEWQDTSAMNQEEYLAYLDESRRREHETDAVAWLYVNGQYEDGSDVARNVLRKLEFASGSVSSDEDSDGTHPSFRSRITLLPDSTSSICGTCPSFCGTTEEDGLVAQLRLVTVVHAGDVYRCFLRLDTTDLMNGYTQVGTVRLVDTEGVDYRFSPSGLRTPIAIGPGQSRLLVYEEEAKNSMQQREFEKLAMERIVEIDLALEGVDEWRQCASTRHSE